MAEQETTGQSPEQCAAAEGGVLHDIAVLDLRTYGPEGLKGVASIRDVAVLIVPEELGPQLAQIDVQDVASVIRVPQGADVSVQVGQLRLSGEALAEAPADRILVLVGQIVFTSPVEKIGLREIRITGQVIAPHGSEAALSAKVTGLTGQVIYYPWPGPDTDVRFLIGNQSIGRQFLEALAKPTVLIAIGNTHFEEDVEAELLRTKVPVMTFIGNVSVPRPLRGVVEALAVERMGNLLAYPPGARFYAGDDALGGEDFEYLSERGAWVISGVLTLGEDVTPDMVKAKVGEIILGGVLRAPKRLLPLVRSLISEKDGVLEALDEPEAE